MSLTWPDGTTINTLSNIIFETQHAPFGLAVYNPNETVVDFVGRADELAMFKEQILLVANHKISRAVRLEGPGGVGKSTMFNYLKESIEKERGDASGIPMYITKDRTIFSTYFQAPDRIMDFSDIWRPMLDGLRPGFDRETSADIGLPEYTMFHITWKMFSQNKDKLAEIIWPAGRRPPNLHLVEFKDIIEPLLDGGRDTVKRLQDYFKEAKRELRDAFKVTIHGNHYEISRSDNSRINDLFRVLDEDDEYLDLVTKGSSKLFHNNDELISFFNDLMRYYACATGKQPIFLIGIDEVAKQGKEDKETFYMNLGKLLVKLRNSLNYILFAFISTTEDWARYDEIITKNSDLLSQTNEFIKKIVLNQLEVGELIQVFKNRMNRFWQNYSAQQSHIVPFYPFTASMFEYVYRYMRRNLRNAIQLLHEFWTLFKRTRVVPKLEAVFECMQAVRQFYKRPFEPGKLESFEWRIIAQEFNKAGRFASNAARSSAIETGIEAAWRCLTAEQPPAVTRVENNPVIQTTSGRRRPDIYIEIHGNLGAELRRHVEFQVKAYGDNAQVDLKHIESSIELFNEHSTDFIYFIITGKGLSPDAEAKVRELEGTYPNRIRRPGLTENQVNALYLLALYPDVVGSLLGEDPVNDLKIARSLLHLIIGQEVMALIDGVINLPFRPMLAPARLSIEPLVPLPVVPVSVPALVPDLKPALVPAFQKSTPVQLVAPAPQKLMGAPLIPVQVKWLDTYPQFADLKRELCALCGYLKTRESTKFKAQFTVATVSKNVVEPDASLDKARFTSLVRKLRDAGFIEEIKTSYKLSDSGEALYKAIKADNFGC